MQDIIGYAAKNNVDLINAGYCQFCGAHVHGGIFECLELFSTGLNLLNLNELRNHPTRFLTVDAHALQHPEIHGRWNNHFHLTRLNLSMYKNILWNYKKSPLLSEHLKDYKTRHPNEILIPPPPKLRGILTAKDLAEANTAESCIQIGWEWAEKVYLSWKDHHELISDIAESFIFHYDLYLDRRIK